MGVPSTFLASVGTGAHGAQDGGGLSLGCLPPLSLASSGHSEMPSRQGGIRSFFKSWGLLADWQDPEFMRDVEAATGVDLGSSQSSGRGKGKRRKHPGLADLKQQTNTARARIAKKVFAK